MDLAVGNIVEGKVTSIMKFGAFVAFEGGKSGLIHISEIANAFVNDVHDFLQEGQMVKVLVLSEENGKINLSLKKAAPQDQTPAPRPARPAPRPVAAAPAAPVQEVAPKTDDQIFEEKLKKFLSSSEGKISDLNHNLDGKRGGGRRRR